MKALRRDLPPQGGFVVRPVRGRLRPRQKARWAKVRPGGGAPRHRVAGELRASTGPKMSLRYLFTAQACPLDGVRIEPRVISATATFRGLGRGVSTIGTAAAQPCIR